MRKGVTGAISLGVILILGIVVLATCTTKIKAGYVGVQYNMNGGIKSETLGQGWHVVPPTVHVTEYTVGIEQSYLTSEDKGDSKSDESFIASSREGKAMTIDLTFTYQYDAERVTDVFTKFKGQSGVEVRDSFIKPNIVSWTKEVVATYKVADILGAERANVNAKLTEYLHDKFEPYGIIVSNVSLINVTVDSETEQSINDKIKAQQNAERQAIENQTNVDKATAEAEAKRIEAQGKADALEIESKAEADANARINESLTNNIIQKEYIDKWDGVLPKVSSDGGTLVNVGNLGE